MKNQSLIQSWKKKIFVIIFGTDTPAGRLFDMILLWAILISVMVVVLESVPQLEMQLGKGFYVTEWIFTVLFSIEYLLRILSSPKPLKYIFSFLGLIDLMAVLPTYMGLFYGESHYLLTIRAVRLLRVFRILKLGRYLGEAEILVQAIRSSAYKITVFLGAVITVVLILGTLMYLAEGGQHGFDSIPQSIYWSIVTITTVGYGDIVPVTVVGKIISSIMMITGYAIIAVPTGIVTVELGRARKTHIEKQCNQCGQQKHEPGAKFCHQCGSPVNGER